jgi:hypothetical protein
VVVLGLLFGGAGSGGPDAKPTSEAPLPTVTVSAPTRTDAATVSTCAQLISALPLTLAGESLRLTVSEPPSPSIVAWGDPAIVLRCGVARPAELKAGSDAFIVLVNRVNFLSKKVGRTTVFTVVDRSVYVDVSVPSSYPQPPLGPIATAVGKVLPTPVCVVDPNTADLTKLCTRRR